MTALLGSIGVFAMVIALYLAYGARVIFSLHVRLTKIKTSLVSLIPDLTKHLNYLSQHLQIRQFALPCLYPILPQTDSFLEYPLLPFKYRLSIMYHLLLCIILKCKISVSTIMLMITCSLFLFWTSWFTVICFRELFSFCHLSKLALNKLY